jgi:alpha-mannosidase
VFDRSFDVEFGVAEIKTWRVPLDPAEPVAETDLLEC